MLILRKLKKQTYTELYTKWDSYIPYKYKQNLILTLLDRAIKICSNYKLIHKEFQNISVALQKKPISKFFSRQTNFKLSQQKVFKLKRTISQPTRKVR